MEFIWNSRKVVITGWPNVELASLTVTTTGRPNVGLIKLKFATIGRPKVRLAKLKYATYRTGRGAGQTEVRHNWRPERRAVVGGNYSDLQKVRDN